MDASNSGVDDAGVVIEVSEVGIRQDISKEDAVVANRQRQLQQEQHLTKVCKLWAPTWKSTDGWG